MSLITRPAIANERLTRNKAEQVVLTLKTPYRDATHIVLSPQEFMQRQAALISRPRPNLICLHGVLAPNAKQRAQTIPCKKKSKSSPSDANNDVLYSPASARICLARLLKWV